MPPPKSEEGFADMLPALDKAMVLSDPLRLQPISTTVTLSHSYYLQVSLPPLLECELWEFRAFPCSSECLTVTNNKTNM